MMPPRVARRLAGRLAPADLRASLVDDLDEAFARQVQALGRRRARWWYRRQALAGLWTFAVLRADRRSARSSSLTEADAVPRASFATTAWQDLHYAWRALRHRPYFAGVAVLSLALGIGASTAMFSVVNGVLLRPLALPDPGRLMLVGERVPQIAGSEKFAFIDNPAAFLAWRRQATDFSGLAALSPSQFTLAGGDRPLLLHGAHVSTNFFDILGVRAGMGRLLTAPDEHDASRPMVITDRLWRTAFEADPRIVGRRVGVPGSQATIVGVLPAGFRLEGRELGPVLAGQPSDYFDALLRMDEQKLPVFSDFNYSVIGRLRPGVTPAAALAQLDAIQATLARSAPDKLDLFAQLAPLREYAVAEARRGLWLLQAGVLAVLLIVCVNLGGLWVTRVADHRRDWAIRAALGASPGRLARQVLGESLIVAVAGGWLGVACAAASLNAMLAAAPASLPRLSDVGLDWRVLGFGLLLSLAAGLVTGLVPALRLTATDPQNHLRATSGATTADRSSLHSRQALIAVQAALSTVLLTAAGLLGLSFYRLVSQPTGFTAGHALAADVVLGVYGDDARRDDVLKRLRADVAALPGVTEAGFTSYLPLRGETWIDSIAVPGRALPLAEQPHVNVRFVSPGYFAAMGVPLLAGRDLDERDRPSGPPPTSAATQPDGVVVLSQATARMLWPGVRPDDLLGRALDFENHTVHVIGVAADTRATLSAPAPTIAYAPYWEETPYRISLVVRSATSAAILAAPLRAAIWRVAPLAPIPALRPLDELETEAVAPERYQLTLLLLFASLALLLAAMGVHALVAHSVARRRKELALRITLGASAGNLWRLILGQALTPVAMGVVAGLVVALATGRLLAALLFQVSPTTPLVLAPAALAVLAAAGAACLLPANRAIRADPWPAIRAE
jgi:putative ABC transport system permease protein